LLWWLDPKNFHSLKLKDIKAPIFYALADKLNMFYKEVTAEKLRTDYKKLIDDWDALKNLPWKPTKIRK